MTKVNMKSNASNARNKKVRVVTRSITLAAMIADIHKDRKNATITTKKARVYLRANYASIHARNAAWVFSQSEYDAIRAHFDPLYAKTVARRAKKSTPVATPEPVA